MQYFFIRTRQLHQVEDTDLEEVLNRKMEANSRIRPRKLSCSDRIIILDSLLQIHFPSAPCFHCYRAASGVGVSFLCSCLQSMNSDTITWTAM